MRPPQVLAIAAGILAVAATGCRPGESNGTRTDEAGNPVYAASLLLPDDEVHAAYAGSASCKECHEELYAKWQDSNHGMAERAYREDLDADGFSPAKTLKHGPDTSEMFLDDMGVATFLTQGLGSTREKFQVARVIGHNPLRQFLVPAPGGRLQTMDVSWDPNRKEWFDVYGDEERLPGDWGHWTGQGMNWNAMCAACHNTRLRKNYDANTDTYHTRMAEMSVGCESCHGPMKDHGDWQREAASLKKPTSPDPTIRKFSRDQHFDTCGACHARRSELTGDLVPGDPFHQHFQLTHTDETPIYFPDGQVREENYEYASMLSSRMHAAGVRCVDCHDPHTGKRLLPGNLLCMRCHGGVSDPPAPIINPATHTPCGENTTGGQCTACHMPITNYMQRHPRHDHGFTIPDPLLTREFGIPNACNRCHTDKDTDWAIQEADAWYGKKLDRPTRQRAMLFARARRGDADARQGLIDFLADKTQTPIWKAGACRLLGRWVSDEAAQRALTTQLSHLDPLVRTAAIHALAPVARGGDATRHRTAIRPLLEDESRAVRIAAAWTLCDTLDLKSTAGTELLHMLNLASDQPAGQLQLGQLAHARGDSATALTHMRRAIELDPNSPPIHHDLAILLNAMGDLNGCIASLREAIRLDPEQAEYHYKLSLALSENQDIAAATAALKETVRLDPGYARAWYNLGLAHSAGNRPDAAIDALTRAETLQPDDPSIPYARATILARLGRKEDAIAALQQALRIQPNHPESHQLLEMLLR